MINFRLIVAMLGLPVFACLWASDALFPSQDPPREAAFREILDDLAKNGLVYDVSFQQGLTEGDPNSDYNRPMTICRYRVNLPVELKAKIDKFDNEFWEYYPISLSSEKKYSYYVFLLIAGHLGEIGPGGTMDFLDAKSKEKYDVNTDRWVEVAMENIHASHDVRGLRFFNSIPSSFQKFIFTNESSRHGSIVGYSLGHSTQAAGHRSYNDFQHSVYGLLTQGEAEREKALRAFPYSRDIIDRWLYLLLIERHVDDEAVKCRALFSEWCGLFPNNADLLAIAQMGMIRADGYAYDYDKDIYQLLPKSIPSLDFVVKHPVKENAFYLKSLMAGGCEAIIGDMMDKSGTRRAWQELLKDPRLPEFHPYRQEHREDLDP